MKPEIVRWMQGSQDYTAGLDILRRCKVTDSDIASLEKTKNPALLKYMLRRAYHRGIVPAAPVQRAAAAPAEPAQSGKEQKSLQPAAEAISMKKVSAKVALEQKKSPLSTSTSLKEKKAGFIRNILSFISGSSTPKKEKN